MIEEARLRKFLAEAKRATYASGQKASKGSDGSETFQYKSGDLEYRDRYFGGEVFAGQEVVLHEGKPVWSMIYRGSFRGQNTSVDSKRVFEFLRKALSAVKEESPFRGPDALEEGDFKYEAAGRGNLWGFVGAETIHYKGQEVYRLGFNGGKLE